MDYEILLVGTQEPTVMVKTSRDILMGTLSSQEWSSISKNITPSTMQTQLISDVGMN